MIKAQALADFIAKFTGKEDEDEGLAPWIIRTDGSSKQHAWGIEVILQLPEGDLIECAIYLQFPTTNNEANYEAILTGLDLAKAVEASLVVIQNDSQVIVEHINRDYKIKGEQMKEYLSMVKERVSQKFLAKCVQIQREENEKADHLAKAAFVEHMVINDQVLSFVQYSLAIDKIAV